jgi:hypothetical protein
VSAFACAGAETFGFSASCHTAVAIPGAFFGFSGLNPFRGYGVASNSDLQNDLQNDLKE